MIEGIRSVLLAGLDDAVARRVVVALGSLGTQFRRAPVAAVLGDPARAADTDVIIVHYAGDHTILEPLAGLAATWTSRTRPAALLVLCEGQWFHHVEPFVGCGVGRVVLLKESNEQLRAAVSSILGAAPRYRVRAPIRLLTPEDAGDWEAFGTTENISSSGMLVSCPLELPVGSTFQFEISPVEDPAPIRGSATVVRWADPEREGVQGVGAQFFAVPPPDRHRLEWLLSDRMH